MPQSIFLKQNLVYLIREENRSLSQVAKKAKMNKSTLHGYMTGVLPRGVEGLVLLAHELKISPAELLFSDLQNSQEKNLSQIFSPNTLFELILRPVESPQSKSGQKKGNDDDV